MKIKTSELTDKALDWAVAIANGENINCGVDGYSPSTDWAQGGAIIEREILSFFPLGDGRGWASGFQNGATPLIAAMRCYVASKLGDEVDVPDELMEVE